MQQTPFLRFSAAFPFTLSAAARLCFFMLFHVLTW
jgi:hypothetical protein